MKALFFCFFFVCCGALNACVLNQQPAFHERIGTARNINVIKVVAAELRGIEVVYKIQTTQNLLGKLVTSTDLVAYVGHCGGVRLNVGLKYLLITESAVAPLKLEKSDTRIIPIEVAPLQDVSDDRQKTRLITAVQQAVKTRKFSASKECWYREILFEAGHGKNLCTFQEEIKKWQDTQSSPSPRSR
jgi:hypothetical protein